MDKRQARTIAEMELEPYRAMPYSEILARIGEVESFEKVYGNGDEYRVEVEFFFDDEDERNIRVSSAISYSFWSDFSPVCNDFIIAPDGTFVDE